ncbi:MAG: glutathione S-transferase family protein [Rhizobiales bacterium]|nr:glutathione S-transferase family protein [Hyphomicrobiales bacterium]
MARKLYDLAGAEPERRFSPYCWRTKLALAHKGLDVDTVPWRFTDKDVIAFSGQGLVPVRVDGDKTVHDSWTIANHLEDTYPDRPSLFGGAGGRAVSRLINEWAALALTGPVARAILMDIYERIAEKDRAYFRESREKRFGKTLEEVAADPEGNVKALRSALEPVRATLKTQAFVGGDAPLYADFIVFGHLQWARCISPLQLLAADDPVAQWRERILAHYEVARSAPAYAA